MTGFASKAATKTAAASGNWGTAATWSPSGIPAATDSVIIPNLITVSVAANASIAGINVQAGGTLSIVSAKTLTMSQSLTVAGTMTMNGGNITFAAGKTFNISAGGSFTWEPGTNTVAAATLFTNGVENFASTSTLIIKKWYNQAGAPLGSVVTGNFGNLTISLTNTTEWNQANQFQSHLISGTLTITYGWITFDKSGTISNTTVGNIVLNGLYSYLNFHNGTHPGSFTVNTANLTVTDGTFEGLYNGNGNITLNVTGNVMVNGAGYLFLVMNSGVASVGNGNAVFTVSGNYIQSGANSRFQGIYNVTTTSAGTMDMTISGNLSFTGGTFMLHYACHTGTDACDFIVSGNTSIAFGTTTDKFWLIGLTTLSTTNNTSKLNFKNSGSFSISGNTTASFTSSAASGIETDTITGAVVTSGGENGFNWPCCTSSSHATTVVMSNDVSVSGGILVLSYFGGALTSSIAGNLAVSGGTFTVKNESGAATLAVAGSYNQTAGNFYFHNNTTAYTTDVVSVVINGDFTQYLGAINFDNNTSAGSAQHTLTLNGANYSLTQNATITRADGGAGTRYGLLYFNRGGTISMVRTGTGHLISQVKQIINNGCTLDVTNGNIQVSTHSVAATDYLKVSAGAALILHNNGQITGNGTVTTNTGIRVDATGTIKLQNANGFYDGTTSAGLSSANNMDFLLDPNSTIEYNGTANQVVTGSAVTNRKYGNLTINFGGTPNTSYVYLNSSNVAVRNILNLVNGELNLNGFTLTLENGASNAISRASGYIKSEQKNATNNSILTWKSMTTGSHVFPFGKNSSNYLPVIFNVTGGSGNDVSVSTRATDAADNLPLATGVTQMNNAVGEDVSSSSVIDRWWKISATGTTATITLTYASDENSLRSDFQTGSMGLQRWAGYWVSPTGTGTGTVAGTGTVTATGINAWGDFVISSSSSPLPIKLLYFHADLNNHKVDLSWATASETNNDYFDIERSADGMNFVELLRKAGAGNTTTNRYYEDTDGSPMEGKSYYRLKQTDYDGHYTYSPIRFVNNKNEKEGFRVESIGPNPFTEEFSIHFSLDNASEVNITMIGLSGQVFHTENFQGTAGINTYRFTDNQGLPKGTYIVNLVCNDQKITQKIIKN
ncbi:MAG: T9SS type A sorting domain-containing protein [Bacteroidetes bacterium]|nr:T9SS type A sorting domain-containing protein [Bacteroidota bacterium]